MTNRERIVAIQSQMVRDHMEVADAVHLLQSRITDVGPGRLQRRVRIFQHPVLSKVYGRRRADFEGPRYYMDTIHQAAAGPPQHRIDGEDR